MVVIGLILFVLLIVVHEFGHFIAARRSGVEVEEFGLGFPPRLYGRKGANGVLYTVNLVALGGFVRLKGENDADDRPGSFGAARYRNKVKIILAGVIMNLITAFVILTALAWVGIPRLLPGQYRYAPNAEAVKAGVIAAIVESESPAEAAGMKIGDRILTLNEVAVTDSQQLINLTDQYAGQPVEVRYASEGKEEVSNVTLREKESEGGILGVGPADETVERYTYAAPLVGAATTLQFSWLTLKGVGLLFADLFTGNFSQAADSVSGPVGIFVILNNIDIFGWSYLFALMAIISITLAVMNALPIPALDGGRLAVMSIFRWLKKPLPPALEDRIHGMGFAVLMLLIALITFVDIKRLF